MKTFALLILCLMLVAGLSTMASAQQAPEAAAKPQTDANARTYVKNMVGFMKSPDPRLRFSVREALRVMGPLAISGINEAKATETNKHVQAFMTRTVTFLKNASRNNNNRRFNRGQRDVDIDRLAMDANLTWEQMEKALPILQKIRKDARDLFTEFREAGGNFRDQESMKDLQEELKAMASQTEPKLKEFLSESQVKQMRRYLNPMGQMMQRRPGGRTGGERGQRPGGERQGRQRPGGGGDGGVR